LSRAPELFVEGAKCTKPSAVWAMSAVLFALRTGGDYPFVTRDEVRTRPRGGAARERFDKRVRDLSRDLNSESVLRERIKQEFPNGSGKLMSEMLQFDPNKRPTAAKCAERWQSLLRPWIPPIAAQSVSETETDFKDLVAYLKAVALGMAEMSSRQWERTSTAIEKLETKKIDNAKLSKLYELRQKVKAMRESAAV
jgi:hypothetical protein